MDPEDNQTGSVNLKPKHPESYDGKRDFLTVSTWLYKVEQYLLLVQINNPGISFTEENKIIFVSTLLSGSAAI